MTKKSFGKRGALVLILGVLTLSAPTAYSQVKDRVALLRAKELLASKKYDSARETLQSILKKDKNSPLAQEAWLLEARAMHLQGKHLPALESLDSFLTTFKKSPYKKRARHLLAESYHSLKKYSLAAAITKEELQEVASPAYRLKLARLYLDLGDEAYDGKEVPSSTPGKTVTRRDYHRANQFYAKALAIQVPADLETPARMRQAECQRALGQHAAAVQTLTLILERFPESKHIEKVRFEKGEALFALGRYEDARAEFRLLEADSPAYAAKAMERLGDSYRPTRSNDKESSLLGISHWKRVLKSHKDYKDTERLHWKLAEAYSHLGRHGDSESAYRAFLRLSKNEDKNGDARYLIATSYYKRGQYEQARQAFGTFLGRHPSHRLFATVQRSIARSWLDEGKMWAKKKDLKEAVKAIQLWRQFLKRYPVHGDAPKVQGDIARFWVNRKKWDKAIVACQEAVNKYPNNRWGARAQIAIAEIYERAKKDLNKAIDAYVKVTQNFRGHPEYWRAKEILRVMRDTSLRVETPRSFHTGESSFMKVSTRNIPELTFKAYKVDLKEYFRKEFHIGNVQSLAVALVTPDKKWTVKTKEYEKYRLLSNKVDMPFKEEGAWIVTVENDGFVATSLIIRTDIVTVVKRSRNHLFIFAKNRRTGLPAEGVDVLTSNRGKILNEGKTGSDGVYQLDLKHQYNVRVFAHKQESYAFARANEKNSQSFGYKPKGYIYTDRPVYRPGQEVNFKIILRDVANGSYVLPKKKDKILVRIYNASGQSIYERSGKTNEFGSLRGKLRVSAEASQGEYSIQVSMGYHNFRGCFYVEDYKKPEFLVNVSASKNDYLTGETVSGTIEARSYYGGPVTNADVEYEVYRTNQPFDASIHKNNAWFYKKTDTDYIAQDFIVRGKGKTDKQGRLKFNFKTKAIDSDSRYALRAVVRGPDRRWISGSGQFYCTSKGYYAIVSSDKKVARPKEKLTINVSTVAASHQGLAAKGELRILRLSAIGGKATMAETVLQVLPLTTATNGKKSMEVSLPRPGEYELRFVGKDRRGTEVEGSVRIVASGDAEDLAKQAKVRADKEVYRRGDKARILLNSPKADTYALLTFEGSRVLDYRVLHLKKRSTVLELPMKDLYAPNVFVKVAIPTEDGFYQDEDEILVFKYLNVEIEADKKSYSPEGKAQFKIKTLDQSGQPVAAELSLSVVDEKVYALRSETVSGMKPFFYDQRRKNIVTTAVSSSWRYRGHTRAQVSEIIREKRESEREAQLDAHARLVKNKLSKIQKQLKRLEKDGNNSAGSDGVYKNYKGRGRMRPSAPKSALKPQPKPAPEPSMTPDNAPADKERKEKAGEELDDEAAESEPGGLAATKVRKNFADTAFWSAGVVTDASGVATVTIDLPSDLTLWRATARGVTSQTLVGEATAQIAVTKSVVASVAWPRFLTHKDKAVITVSGHNRTDKALRGRLSVKLTKLAANSAHIRKMKELEAGQRRHEDLETSVLGVGEAEIEARYETGTASDAVLRKIPIKAFGEPVQVGQSGVLTDAELWNFEVGANRIPNTAKVKVKLFAGRQGSLLSGLRYVRSYPYGCVEQTVNRFLPLAVSGSALNKMGVPRNQLRQEIGDEIRRGIARLSALQRTDGGWGWWKKDVSAPFTTAYALLGLELVASQSHVDAGVLSRGRSAARSLLRRSSQNADARALLLFVLAGNTQLDDDFNRALRARDQLSAQGTAWLYLACKRSKRAYNTAALIEDLKTSVMTKGKQSYWVGSRRRGWTHESTEASAWAAYALLSAEPNNILVERVANTLMARQKNGYWRSTKETAAVIFFLSSYIDRKGLSNLNGSLSVEVNGKPFAKAKLEGKFLREKDVELTIPGNLLKTGRNTLRLVKQGPGKVNYSFALTYVDKADSLKNKGPLLSFDRRYRRFIRGASSYDIPGWSIVRSSARPSLASRPSLLETVSGQRMWVDLVVKTRESLPYVMIEDMLPAGCEILRGKESGRFQRFEARDDRAVFFVTKLSSGTHRFRYMVQAVTPGEFAVLPAQGGPMYEPEVFAHGASAVLTIHSDAKSLKKAEELTPDELYANAKRYQVKKQDQKAITLFKEIRANYKLQSNYDEDILARLLQLAVRQREANLTVTSYEALKDINPRRVNRLDKKTLTHLVVAYNVVGEFQRSHNLGRKVLLRYFEEEAQLASVYRNLGRPLPAQNYMRDLLIRYPESNSIKEQWFNLASRYLSIAKPIKKGSAVTMPMYTTAYNAFKDYCALFPDSSLAAQAQLNAADALQKLQDFKGADREASFVLARHSDTRIREKALILLMRSRYARKKWDGTFQAGQGLLKLRHKNGNGYYSKSNFVPEVHYTFAKIYHVQGKLAKAVDYYKLCRNKFTDAADNYQYFTETGIVIPDNVTAEPGKQAKLTLRSKNLKEMKLKVYPVDFMTLFLTRKNLRNIHQVKLTGIKPVLSKTYSLAKGAKFAWTDHTIDLPMKKTGVYLVVAKSGDFDRSSLVVISDLKIKVQADGSGVRVYASKNGKPCEGARVRVTDGYSLVLSGKTDARGVFHPQGRYRASVRAIVVEYKGHYAIYRR